MDNIKTSPNQLVLEKQFKRLPNKTFDNTKSISNPAYQKHLSYNLR